MARVFEVHGLRSRRSLATGVLALGLLAGCQSGPAPNGGPASRPSAVPSPTEQGAFKPKDDPETVAPTPLTPVGPTATDRARESYLRALEFFDARDYDLAYAEFGKALDSDPTFYKAWFKKGLCQYYKQKYDFEIECYQRCVEIKPDYVPALLNLAHAHFAMDQIEKAVPLYHKILSLEPRHPVALYNLGVAYFNLEEFSLAVQFLERYTHDYPTDSFRTKADLYVQRARGRLDASR